MHGAAVGNLQKPFSLRVSQIAFQCNVSLNNVDEFTLSLAILTVCSVATLMTQYYVYVVQS